MSVTLFLSSHPDDALFGAGALMAHLPAGSVVHANAYAPAGEDDPASVRLSDAFAAGRAAFESLGVQAIEGSLVAPPNVVDDAALTTKLSALLSTVRPDTVILPLGLAHRDADLQLIAVCLRLRQQWAHARWLQYYDQPFVGFHRGRYPELAFARRVRLLAEVDEEASMFNWKPVGAPAPQDPLQRKLEACLALDSDTIDECFFAPQTFDFPTDPALVREHVARVIGQREWLSTMA